MNRGEAHGEDSVKNAIVSAQENLIKKSGGVPVLGSIVKRTTLAHYKAAIANHTSISLVEKTRSKTSCRIASERCEKRLACHLGIMCSTHFFSVTEEDPEIRQELEGLPEDCRFCYDAATKARGTAVYPVKPHNLWNVDDT